MDAALAVAVDGGTVGSLIEDQAATIGEKVELRQVSRIAGEKFAVYLHRTSKDLPPQIGVVVAYTGDDADTARSVAQHISFAAPVYLSREDVPEAEVANERRIVEQISREEGKPEAALPKIVEGRLGAFFKQVSLLEQDYARDNKLSISDTCLKKAPRRPSTIFGRAASGLPSSRLICSTMRRSFATSASGTSSRDRYTGAAKEMCWAMLRAVSASSPV